MVEIRQPLSVEHLVVYHKQERPKTNETKTKKFDPEGIDPDYGGVKFLIILFRNLNIKLFFKYINIHSAFLFKYSYGYFSI